MVKDVLDKVSFSSHKRDQVTPSLFWLLVSGINHEPRSFSLSSAVSSFVYFLFVAFDLFSLSLSDISVIMEHYDP